MGYWGTGSFENDYSVDIFYEFMAGLSNSIKTGIQDPEVVEWDSFAIDNLVVNMEIFMALVDRKLPISPLLDSTELTSQLAEFEKQWVKNAVTEEFHTRRLTDIKALWLRVITAVAAIEEKHRTE